jgi:hypothetical protein
VTVKRNDTAAFDEYNFMFQTEWEGHLKKFVFFTHLASFFNSLFCPTLFRLKINEHELDEREVLSEKYSDGIWFYCEGNAFGEEDTL